MKKNALGRQSECFRCLVVRLRKTKLWVDDLAIRCWLIVYFAGLAGFVCRLVRGVGGRQKVCLHNRIDFAIFAQK